MVWRGIKGSAGRLAVALLAVFAGAATAQSWPAKPLKFVMTAPAGSSIDVIGRILGDKLKDTLRQPVVVENRAGAGGTLATDYVAKSAPDGYTLVLSFNGPLAYGPHMYAKLPYEPLRDLAAVVRVEGGFEAVDGDLARGPLERVAVAELLPGGGYYTRMISRTVGGSRVRFHVASPSGSARTGRSRSCPQLGQAAGTIRGSRSGNLAL